MASEALAGVGTRFARWNGSAWEDLAEINSIEGPTMTKDVIETTSLDTDAGYNEFITGFAEGGILTLDMNFTRETYELMKSDFEIDELVYYAIILPDAEETTLSFAALVTEIPITVDAGDKISADITLQISSTITLDSASIHPPSDIIPESSDIIIPESSDIVPESSDLPAESSDSMLDQLISLLGTGNTIAFYSYERGVTVEETDKIILWEDLMGSEGLDLAELESDGTRPTLTSTGVLFDGVDDVLDQVGTFTCALPVTIYAVVRNLAYLSNAKIISFNSSAAIELRQYTNGGRFSFATDNTLGIVGDYALSNQRFLAVINYDGALSHVDINGVGDNYGTLGTARIPNKIRMGKSIAGLLPANAEVVALILREEDDSDGDMQGDIRTLLNDMYVHYPIGAVVENATPLRVEIIFNELIDETSLDILPTDFTITTRTSQSLDLSADGKRIYVTLTAAIVNGWTGSVTLQHSSAGGPVTMNGDQIPYFTVPVVNNVL